jgi:hypothetical protein
MYKQSHPVPTPFSHTYLDVLAVCCSDGRYIEAVNTFLESRGIPKHDLLAFPGGPGHLCRDTASYSECADMLDAFDFLVSSHKTREILLIAHEHCGYYAKRLGQSEEARQCRDMLRVRTRILDSHRNVSVLMFFARPHLEAEIGFTFEELAPDGN